MELIVEASVEFSTTLSIFRQLVDISTTCRYSDSVVDISTTGRNIDKLSIYRPLVEIDRLSKIQRKLLKTNTYGKSFPTHIVRYSTLEKLASENDFFQTQTKTNLLHKTIKHIRKFNLTLQFHFDF